MFKPYYLKEVIDNSNKELFTVISTFAGGGGSSTGYRLAGGKLLCVNEFVQSAVDTYGANYPNTPILDDDTKKHLKSELGDICWYMAQALIALDSSWEEIFDINVGKLSERYPGGFDALKSASRKVGDI